MRLIVICEIGFWVVLLMGLIARYLFKLRRAGTALLICVPLIDLALFVAALLDLTQEGAKATYAHGLVAFYIGFTIAFGHSTIRWADKWFAYRFSTGPRPKQLPSGGWEYILNDWKLFGRALIAYGLTAILLSGVIELIGEPERTEGVLILFRVIFVSSIMWFIFGPLYSTIFKRKA